MKRPLDRSYADFSTQATGLAIVPAEEIDEDADVDEDMEYISEEDEVDHTDDRGVLSGFTGLPRCLQLFDLDAYFDYHKVMPGRRAALARTYAAYQKTKLG